jgi:ribokinase
MKRRFDCIGLGYTALDYLGIVPRFPVENRKLELDRFTIQGGGPTATALVTANRLGLSTAFIGKVGDDDFGARMLRELAREGVDTSAVVVEAGASSQFAFIMVDAASAARTILWTRGNLSPLDPSDVDDRLLNGARILLIDSLEPAAARVMAERARERGMPVVIDAGTLRDGVEELLPLCDYIVASEIFAEQVSDGGGLESSLEALFAHGPTAAVVTLGERGCAARSADGDIVADGFAIEAVDTTGAGDVFHGAFLFAVLQGWDIRRMCIFANAVAALSCRRLGGRAGIPDLDETIAFLHTAVPGTSFEG